MKPYEIKILIACEHSGAMFQAFYNRGFTVMSCDLKPASHSGEHYQGDVFDLPLSSFDFIMAFWPCTYFAKAQMFRCRPGSVYLQRQQYHAGQVKALMGSGVPHFALENPVGALPNYIGNYTQKVHPFYFGDPYSKEICLWLRDMPPVMSTLFSPGRKPVQNHVNGRMSQDLKSEIKSSWLWYPLMCDAIAAQWGSWLLKHCKK